MGTMKVLPYLPARRPRGFTLVELMVAMAIGLVTTLVITQVLLFSEGQKRTTTSGADAQTNGALALYTLQQDIQMAGYGFASSPELIGCPIHAKYNGADVATGAAPPAFPVNLVPVVIDATDPVRNSIRVLSSSKTTYSVPTRIIPPNYDPGVAAKKFIFPVMSELGIEAGDLLIAAKDATTNCEVFQAVATPTTAQQVGRVDDTAHWNPAGFPAATYSDGDALVNLGQVVDHTYSVSAGNSLRLKRFTLSSDGNFTPSYTDDTVSAADLFPNIVNMQALYGKDTNGDGVIDKYDQTAPTTNAEWLQVLAIRVAVVARSGQYEKDPNTTTANPLWQVGASPVVNVTPAPAACGTGMCLTLHVDGLADWTHYRYKVFDTVIPLRNMVWKS
jgi:type IV pilus assembly protein PilW